MEKFARAHLGLLGLEVCLQFRVGNARLTQLLLQKVALPLNLQECILKGKEGKGGGSTRENEKRERGLVRKNNVCGGRGSVKVKRGNHSLGRSYLQLSLLQVLLMSVISQPVHAVVRVKQ